MTDVSLPALPLRSIGPALMGGRIADLAIHPNTTTWYVAVGSGGVWKTTNAGIDVDGDLRAAAELFDRLYHPRSVQPADGVGRHR